MLTKAVKSIKLYLGDIRKTIVNSDFFEDIVLFSSLSFVFYFLPIVIAGYYLLPRKTKNIFLLAVSLYFYAWGEPSFVYVMVGSITVNWFLVLFFPIVSQKVKKLLLYLLVAVNFSLLFYCKYLGFAAKNLAALGVDITAVNIALPIGISFFTFQAMSYCFDVYTGKAQMQKNPLNVALYIAFFPQLIAGPIVRFETFAGQIIGRRECFEDFSYGVKRFLSGFAKKILIANQMAAVANRVFAASDITVSYAWLGVLAYTFQIFYDFSGYSDMAIGLGRMFGFHFLENFNYPYIATSITDFWRRWHISLSTWFRDYVYFPLGGSRVVSKLRLVFNLFIVWFLTGVWHGANWGFVLWGLLYFMLITIEKLTGAPAFFARRHTLGRIYTMFFVMIGWAMFRSETFTALAGFIPKMFGFGSCGLYDGFTGVLIRENIFIFAVAALFSIPVMPWLYSRFKKLRDDITWFRVQYAALFLLFFISISFLVKGSYNPFIYFNF